MNGYERNDDVYKNDLIQAGKLLRKFNSINYRL